MAKFCVNCGTQIDDFAQACPNCGVAIIQEPQKDPEISVNNESQPDYVSQSKEPKKNNYYKIIIAVLAVALAAAIAVVGYFILSDSKDDSSEDSKNNKEESSYSEDKDSTDKDKKNDKAENKDKDKGEDKTQDKNKDKNSIDGGSNNSSTKPNKFVSDDCGAMIEKAMNALITADTKTFFSLMPGTYSKEAMMMIEEEMNDYFSAIIKGFKEEYGENVKFKCKVINEKALTDSELREVADSLKDAEEDGMYKIGNITEGKRAEVEFLINGVNDGGPNEFVFIKEDGKWKVIFE